MKLSEIICEYVDLKIESGPQRSDWKSIDAYAAAKLRYYQRLRELEQAIDMLAPAAKLVEEK